jgi:hypothetical protein
MSAAPSESTPVRMVAGLRARAARVAIKRSSDRGAVASAGVAVGGADESDRDAAPSRKAGKRSAKADRRRTRRPGGRVQSASTPSSPSSSSSPASGGASPAPAVAGPGVESWGRGKPEKIKKDKADTGDSGTPRRGTVGNSPAVPPGQAKKRTPDAKRRAAPRFKSAPPEAQEGPASLPESVKGNGKGKGLGEGNGTGDDAPGKSRAVVGEALDALPPKAAQPVRTVLAPVDTGR